MKLKKIASLMLAGIMAVSMLAACGEGKGNSSSSSSSSEAPVTTNAVTYANKVLSGDEKKIVKFENNDDLNAALKAIATDSSKYSSADIIAAFGRFTATNDADLTADVKGKLDWMFNDSLTTAPVDGKSQTRLVVYTISGALDEETAIKEMVKKEVKGNYQVTAANYPESAGGYAFTYTGAVSAIKVSAPDTGDTAWVAAVAITQTATKTPTANT